MFRDINNVKKRCFQRKDIIFPVLRGTINDLNQRNCRRRVPIKWRICYANRTLSITPSTKRHGEFTSKYPSNDDSEAVVTVISSTQLPQKIYR